MQHFGIHSWIEFENILKMDIKSFNPILLDGVLNAVWKIAEDCPNELVHTLETLIPQLISLMTSDTESIRMSSLKALTFIIPGMNKVVISNLPHIFEVSSLKILFLSVFTHHFFHIGTG